MKTLKKLLFSLLLIAGFAGIASAQTSLTQTTLASSVQCGPSCANSGVGSGTSYQTTINLTSATGVQQAVNGQPITFVYIDQELMGILTLQTGQTTLYSVLRAQQGTRAAAHASGAMVLIQVVTPQFGGFAGSGGFQPTDPPIGGACTGSNTLVTPWVNVITSAQWLCSSVTGTWTPGWNNPFAGDWSSPTVAVASAAGLITPSGPLFHITGALAITGFNIPVGFNHGCFTVINDGAYTWTTANNIALASAAGQVVSMTNQFCYDPNTAKFYPAHQ